MQFCLRFLPLPADQPHEMKPSQFLEKLKSNPKLLMAVGGGGIAVIAVVSLLLGIGLGHRSGGQAKSAHIAAKSDAHGETKHAPAQEGLLASYKEAVASVQEKIETLRHLDEQNRKLELENANLRLRLETLQFDCRAEDAAKKSRELSRKLDQETGSRLGRTLASIPYQIPPGVLPHQLFPLAISYFKNREDEKAAVILSFLTGMEEDSTYKTPRNYLLTGIAWYRLENFSAAERFFDRVIEEAGGKGTDESSRKLFQQANLWKAVVSERLGKHRESQDQLLRVLDFNPHSMEAAWVNGKEARRGTASKH